MTPPSHHFILTKFTTWTQFLTLCCVHFSAPPVSSLLCPSPTLAFSSLLCSTYTHPPGVLFTSLLSPHGVLFTSLFTGVGVLFTSLLSLPLSLSLPSLSPSPSPPLSGVLFTSLLSPPPVFCSLLCFSPLRRSVHFFEQNAGGSKFLHPPHTHFVHFSATYNCSRVKRI